MTHKGNSYGKTAVRDDKVTFLVERGFSVMPALAVFV